MQPPHPSSPRGRTEAPRVGIVSLGCPKALVDSERIITRLRAEGYVIAPDYHGADAVLVNTCGFLDSARRESLDAIGEALVENGRVVVTGCLGKEADLIRAEHPEVLAITGPQQYEQVISAIHDAVPPPADPYVGLIPPQGIRLTPRHYAYLKISEGCNNRCSFCIIPQLRGDLASRPAAAILGEAEQLVRAGVKELLVISQDTSAYGVDIRHAESRYRGEMVAARLYDLAAALGEFGVWVRLHYVYPYPFVDKIMPLMADGKILPYIDVPFQHASPTVLKAMRRPANQEKTLDHLAAWRQVVPDLTVRSTFIVGFPGETDAEFEQLLDWLTEAQLDRVGCFQYEPVVGATANDIAAAVPDAVKRERFDRLMLHQQAISERKLQARVGTTMTVMVDAIEDEEIVARSAMDAPEIDGAVYVDHDGGDVAPGDFLTVRITDADAYDLWAEQVPA